MFKKYKAPSWEKTRVAHFKFPHSIADGVQWFRQGGGKKTDISINCRIIQAMAFASLKSLLQTSRTSKTFHTGTGRDISSTTIAHCHLLWPYRFHFEWVHRPTALTNALCCVHSAVVLRKTLQCLRKESLDRELSQRDPKTTAMHLDSEQEEAN